MERTIRNAIELSFNTKVKKIESLGGGFYGRAFSVSIDAEPYEVVAKLYLFRGIAKKEAEQLKMLKKHALLKMPEVFDVFDADAITLEYDVLLMEYICGRNAGWIDVAALPETSRKNICESIVQNLLAYHSVVDADGFGDVAGNERYQTWQEYYYPVACSVLEKAKALYNGGKLSDLIMSVFERSLKSFDSVFCLPITQARLIHGDYNTWNIMLDDKCERAVAVIDPYNCCYADSEYDLYQLDNANGKGYGLLDRYKEIMTLSDNFEAKRRFYELYSEVCHYHDAGVAPDIIAVETLAKKLYDII